MEPLEALLAHQVVHDLEDAEEDAAFPNRRFNDQIQKDAFRDLSDGQFISYFRLSKELLQNLIILLTPYMVDHPAQPRRLTIPKKVLTALRFFGSGSYQGITGSDAYVYVSQASVSRSVEEVCNALNHPEVLNEWVRFPQTLEEMEALRNQFFTRYNFPGVIGCIDCTHVAIIGPPDNNPDYPEHIYVNRKNYHSINVQLICDATLRIINVNSRYPGSAHDARIWRQSPVSQAMEQFYRNNPNNMFHLLGDSGYPLRPWLQTPLRAPEPGTPEERYNNSLTSIRSLIERCNGVLKSRFRCLLKHRVLHYTPTKASKIINACVILHNMCIEQNVPEPADAEVLEGNFGIYDAADQEVGYHGGNPDLEAARRIRDHIIETYFHE